MGDPRARCAAFTDPLPGPSVDSLRAMSAPRSALADTSRHAFSSVRLSEVVGSRDNNFDLLRLLAAWAVLVSHSYAVVGEPSRCTSSTAPSATSASWSSSGSADS